jgi:hypothetical protein
MLIVEEKSDIIFYTNNSFYLEQHLPDAQLILYPDAALASCFTNRSCPSNTLRPAGCHLGLRSQTTSSDSLRRRRLHHRRLLVHELHLVR